MATETETVEGIPVDVVLISGSSAICVGSVAQYAIDYMYGYLGSVTGMWSSSDVSIATIDIGGYLNPISAGIITISFTNDCGSQSLPVAIEDVPAMITGTTALCIGSTTTLADASYSSAYGSYTWWSSDTSIANVGASGIVTSYIAGTVTINFINDCGSTSTIVTVNSMPAISDITGHAYVCVGGNADTLQCLPTGGTWSATNAKATVIGGIVTGVTGGIDTIKYTLTNSCGYADTSFIVNVYSTTHCDSILGIVDSKTNNVENHINIFPNPSVGNFTILVDESINESSIEISMYDIYGKQIFSYINMQKNKHAFVFNLSEIAKGTYFVKIKAEDYVFRKTITIW